MICSLIYVLRNVLPNKVSGGYRREAMFVVLQSF